MSTLESKTYIRVLIVDDHPVVRAGLASLLRRQAGIKLSGAAHSGEEAIEILKRSPADVILLDLRMPAINGIDLLNILSEDPSPPKSIILSSYELEEELYRAIKAGARGYLSKNAPREEIVTAIETVSGGGTYFPDRLSKWMLERDSRSSLSAREIEILEMVSRGLTNKEIAGALQISHYTVRNHINHISAKLEVADRTEAATLALRQGIISSH
ncbi:MAG: response regulator transcription factor [Acidobacteria bacterium]|nr:response regulator transcription factor [Acidobacteriota bacterium]